MKVHRVRDLCIFVAQLGRRISRDMSVKMFGDPVPTSRHSWTSTTGMELTGRTCSDSGQSGHSTGRTTTRQSILT
jgi:hypothetical protein